jgi:hypothetical protein
VAVDVWRLRGRLPRPTWVQASLLLGATLTVVWMVVGGHGLDQRVIRDGTLFILVPLTFAVLAGKGPARLGWRVDRRALRNTVLLATFVLPFYLVGSSLPSIRGFYPMWGLDSTAPGPFLTHTAKQMLVVVAAETYYRGLLCVGVRDVGRRAAFISPVVYALHHASKPPIELALSGPTDVLFGLVDYDADSILPSVVAHGAGLTLLDWLVLHPPILDPARVVSVLEWLPIPV